jgi:hypothetical protein
MNLSLQCKFGHFHLIDVCCPLKCMETIDSPFHVKLILVRTNFFTHHHFFIKNFYPFVSHQLVIIIDFMFPTSISNSFFPKFHLTNKTLCVRYLTHVVSSLVVPFEFEHLEGCFFYLSTSRLASLQSCL